MGKRINLAELAQDDIYESSPAPSPVVTPLPTQQGQRTVPVTTVAPNPLNARDATDTDEEIAELATTLSGAVGMIQPLVVCSSEAYIAQFPDQRDEIGSADWVVLIGNRRLLAAREADLHDVPVIVNDESAASMWEVMLIENVQRRALPELLEARAIKKMIEREGISKREAGRRIGKSHVYIQQRLDLLDLIPELQRAFKHGELTVERAREFGRLDVDEQEQIVAAGKPYRRGGNAVSTRPRMRSIRVSSPATAAESIRQRFTAEELAELVRLLTDSSP